MKYIAILLVWFLSSCSSSPNFTGQVFDEKTPFFYLSIAPSFDKPYEYEIRNDILVLREYSGLGGYNWGTKRVVAKSEMSQEVQAKISKLAQEAIADTIRIEKNRTEVGDVVLVMDGTNWYIQLDVGYFLSISTNNPESKAFNELHSLLKLILNLVPVNA